MAETTTTIPRAVSVDDVTIKKTDSDVIYAEFSPIYAMMFAGV